MGSDPGQPLLWAMSALIAVVLFSLNVIGEQALRQSTETQKESLNYQANSWIAAYFSKIAFGFLAMASITQIINGTWKLMALIVLVVVLVGSEFGLASKVTVENSGLLCQKLGWLLKLENVILWPLTKVVTLVQQKGQIARPTEMSLETIVENIQRQRKESELDTADFEMINGVLSLHDKTAREVMVPRIDAFMIDITNDNDRNIDSILEMDYSRIPVYHEDKDNIVGIVHIKNVLKRARRYGFERLTIRQVMHPAFFVPETMPVDELLLQMQKTQNQMAILLDEYGGVVGLTTLEDILEEIVGEIEDESDEPDKLIEKVAENEFIVQGKMTLTEFNDEFGTKLEMDDIDTIAGYIIAKTGKIPDDDEVLTVTKDDGLVLKTVEIVDDARITKVLAVIPPELSGWRKFRALDPKEDQKN